MAQQNINYNLTNLMIPAFGAMRMVINNFNLINGYTLEADSVTIESIPFRPQSVTIDCSDIPVNETVDFVIRQINFTKRIKGGNTETFNFPSIPNMIFDVTPSSGEGEVRAFFYNFPSFVDTTGVTQVEVVTGGGALDVNLLTADPAAVVTSKISDIDTFIKSTPTRSAITPLATGDNLVLSPLTGIQYIILGIAIHMDAFTCTPAENLFLTDDTDYEYQLPLSATATTKDILITSQFSTPIILAEGLGFTMSIDSGATLGGNAILNLAFIEFPV